MEEQVRPPEWVLDELYRIGQQWMAARARERGLGAPTDHGRGERPPSQRHPVIEEEAAEEATELRDRFEVLAREFIDRVDEL